MAATPRHRKIGIVLIIISIVLLITLIVIYTMFNSSNLSNQNWSLIWAVIQGVGWPTLIMCLIGGIVLINPTFRIM